MPGVISVGAVTNLPLNGGGSLTYRGEGLPEPDPADLPEAMQRGVAGDYFRAVGIPIVAGRPLDARDDSLAPGALVISASMANQLFSGEDAIGRRLRFLGAPDRLWTIVGVAGDVKTAGLDDAPPPTLYYSHLQRAENRMTLVVRSDGDPARVAPLLAGAVRTLDPGVALYGARTMDDVVADAPAMQLRRLPLALIGAFAIAALFLAIVGVHGVTSCAVAARSRELGIRSALGATRRRLMGQVLGHATRVSAVGAGAGLILAFGFSRFLSSLLYDVTATDLVTFAGSGLVLGFVGLLACLAPARRATRVPLSTLLRSD
jgi:predicted permease